VLAAGALDPDGSSEAEHPAQMRSRANPAAILGIAEGYRF
jgi:hypothetical protein